MSEKAGEKKWASIFGGPGIRELKERLLVVKPNGASHTGGEIPTHTCAECG